jgi:hypothetical protein
MAELIEDEKTGQLKVSISCDGTASDEFLLEISTGLYQEDLENLAKGKQLKMTATVVQRESDPTIEDEKSEE